MSNLDLSRLDVPLHELQAYVEAELEAQRRAKKAEAQAWRDQILFEREAALQAEREAEAAARAAGDPSCKAAKALADILGDRLGDFLPALNRVNFGRFVTELTRLNGERESAIRHSSVSTAHSVRVAADEAVVSARKVRVDAELIRLGVTDVTPDEDPA